MWRILSGTSGSGESGTTDKLMQIFSSPILYIVLGSIVLLIIVIYLLRRFVKAKPNASIIVVRGGKVYKIVDESNPKYYLIPFRDSVGAIIIHNEKEFSSDKLYINDGPNVLYKINYTLKYRITDPKEFYTHMNDMNDNLHTKINDGLRLFADKGNAALIIKDYRDNTSAIVKVINEAAAEYYIEVTDFKINYIEPQGTSK